LTITIWVSTGAGFRKGVAGKAESVHARGHGIEGNGENFGTKGCTGGGLMRKWSELETRISVDS
jgi:hypothetical protein